jgi:uncharacterized protein (TIGR03437 family)
LLAGDFNSDGKPDLAVVTSSAMGLVTGRNDTQNAVLILLGKGNGTFSSPVSYSAGPFAESANSIVAGDFNGDGKLDLAVVNAFGGAEDSSSTIGFLFGKGDGTFSEGTSVPVANLESIAAGDFNGDGKLDLAAATGAGLAILLGRGDGSFVRSATYPANQSSLVVADFNRDKILDLIAGNYYLLGNADGTFQPPVLWIGDSFPNGYIDVNVGYLVAADLNRDGRIDLAGISTLGVVSFLNISQQQPAVTVVSSASFAIGPVAPESLATAFGNGLALGTSVAPAGQPLPNMLGVTTVSVEDASGTTRPAPLLYVATGQINFLIPAGTSSGTATITITTAMLGANLVHTAQVQIAPVAPSVFTFNDEGLAAAYVTRVRPGQPQTNESLFTLQNGVPAARPIDLGPAGDKVYLILFGTGVRNAATASVSVDIEGLNAPVSYAGPQNGFEGLDQINVLLPRALVGSGDVSVVLTAAGIAANTVHLTIK